MESIGKIMAELKSEIESHQKENTPQSRKYEQSSNIEENVGCLYCKDIQWLHPVVNGVPDYSRIIECPHCSVQRTQELIEHRAVGLSGIPSVKQTVSFKSFRVNPQNKEAFDACKLLSQGKSSYKLLLIYGNHGNGKTHLAYATGIEAIRNRYTRTWYESVSTLLARIKSQMHAERGDSEMIIQAVLNMQFLILDDWGSHYDTNYADEILERIVSYRYENEMPLLLTTNIDLKMLPKRILSIFSDASLCKVVQNKDIDRRKTPAPEKTQTSLYYDN